MKTDRRKATKPYKKRKPKCTARAAIEPRINLAPSKMGVAPVMTLDVEKYLHQFKDFVLTEEEKVEILQDLWNIMCRLVEFGFGMDSQTIACAKNENKPRIKDGNLVDLETPKDTL